MQARCEFMQVRLHAEAIRNTEPSLAISTVCRPGYSCNGACSSGSPLLHAMTRAPYSIRPRLFWHLHQYQTHTGMFYPALHQQARLTHGNGTSLHAVVLVLPFCALL